VLPASLALDPSVHPTVKAVLLALASFARAGHDAYPSVATLAEAAGVDRRTAQRALAAAERDGYLERHERERPDGGQTSTRYVLQDGRRTSRGGRRARPGGVVKPAAPPVTPAPPEAVAVDQEQLTGAKALQPSRVETFGARHAGYLCDLMADSVERRTGRRPTVTRTWLASARLLVDGPNGPSAEAVREVIAWVEQDEFWRANVLSMPKLRERWDQLVLQRQRGGRKARSLDDLHAMVRADMGLS
jgi:hypothetical protein